MFQYALSAPLPPHYQKPMTVQQCILRAAAPISLYNGWRLRQPNKQSTRQHMVCIILCSMENFQTHCFKVGKLSTLHLMSIKSFRNTFQWNLSQNTIFLFKKMHVKTRTTRMAAFWDTPAAPWLPILVVHIRSHVIKRQSQSCKFQKFAKN